ncbi:MAG: dephospho-CoA kinase [Longimicrobiales bacterium]
MPSRAAVYRVGLTGNIASGKSSVARVWQKLGASVIDADELARRAVAAGSPGLARVRETFGNDVIAADGTLDRGKLRAIVFEDTDRRAALEAIVHPEVARLGRIEEQRLERSGEGVIVHMIPLLFEADLVDTVDEVVLVDAPAAVRLERLVETRGLASAEARSMIEAQLPAEQKRARADVVIENGGSLAQLEHEAETVWRQIRARAFA